MTAAIFAFLFFISISLLIRRRFKSNTKISAILIKIPLVYIVWLAVMILFFITSSNFIIKFGSEGMSYDALNFSMFYLIASVLWMISFCATEGSISNTYFSHKRTRNIYVDINKDFIPSYASLSELTEFIEGFTKKIPSLKRFTCKSVIIKSHLITRGISKKIGRTLQNEGIPFICHSYQLGLSETITLNLWYGGRTRYRLLSHEKHANGFKVHRTGHKFVIHLHP